MKYLLLLCLLPLLSFGQTKIPAELIDSRLINGYYTIPAWKNPSPVTITLTNTGVLLNKNIFSVDLENFSEDGLIFSNPQFERIQDIGFTSLTFGNSSPNHWYTVVIGDTSIYNSSCDGYCCVPEAPHYVLGGDCYTFFGINFFNLAAKLADSLDIPLNLGYNAEYGDTLQLAWMIERGKTKIVQEGLEDYSNGYTNQTTWINGGYTYKAKMDNTVNKFLENNYPEIRRGGDSMPPDKAYSDWNEEINGLNTHFMSRYLFDSMHTPNFYSTDDPIATINEGIHNLYNSIDTAKTLFPDYGLGIYEAGLDNEFKADWYGTQAANFYIIKLYKFIIEYNAENNDYIESVVYKSLRSLKLNDDTPKAHYYGLKQIGEIFKGDTVYTIQTNTQKVYGIGTEKAIVICNDNYYEVSIILNKIPISARTNYTENLTDEYISEQILPTGYMKIKKYGIMVFRF